VKITRSMLVPDLAAAAPTFTLRDGVRFEDGSPVTSKDVRHGIERLFAQEELGGGPTCLIDQLGMWDVTALGVS
jgi:peptide/nickel transport system substrate-binding protein